MSAKLYFSNSPALLLEKLSLNINWSDPFNSPHIATPTPAIKRWVQMQLAEKRGVVANVDFMQLERTLWQRLEILDTEHVVEFRKPAQLLDEQGLQLLILGVLQKNAPNVVREYLESNHVKSKFGKSEARRLCQMSHKLASLFREYEYNRVREHGHKGITNAWKNNEDCFLNYLKNKNYQGIRNRVEQLEQWQRDIYYKLFQTGGVRDQLGEILGQYRYTLPQYAEMVLSQKRLLSTSLKPVHYHLFGLSQVSSFHRSLISQLGDHDTLRNQAAEFYIYSLNPCSEYWEDVLTPRENRIQKSVNTISKKYQNWRALETEEKETLQLSDEILEEEILPLNRAMLSADSLFEETPPLSLWGQPGRENIQLWCQMTQYDFYEHFREPNQNTLLGRLQSAILHREGAIPESEKRSQDKSIKIFACPEIHREVETVYHDLIAALLDDSKLRPDEIAILVPNMQEYRYVFSSVFERIETGAPGYVPFNLAELSLTTESEYAKAIKLLFNLMQGRFSKTDLLLFGQNKCFQNRFGLNENSLHLWEKWVDKLNIFHGFNGLSKQESGYSSEEIHTWNHGMDRLLLGTIMESPSEGDFRQYENIVPYDDGNTSDRDELKNFITIIEALNHDLRPFQNNQLRTWNEWTDLIIEICDRYIQVFNDDEIETFVQQDLRRYFIELKSMDKQAALNKAESIKETRVGVNLPLELILARLEGLSVSSGSSLSGGVNVATLSTMRSLPFKLVYILGLGEGKFPEHEEVSTLDLRQYRRVIGEVSPSARNRYLFLETLMCTEAQIRLSYVSRDLEKGKDLQMCSVLTELKEYIEEFLLINENDTGKFTITNIPLLSHDEKLFETVSKSPWSPPKNPFQNENIVSWIQKNGKNNQRLADIILEDSHYDLQQKIFPPLKETDSKSNEEQTILSLDDIKLFLENPVNYALKKRLQIHDLKNEYDNLKNDEPFMVRFPNDYNLIQELIEYRFKHWNSASRSQCLSALEKSYQNRALKGEMPESYYRVLDLTNILTQGSAILDTIDHLRNTLDEKYLNPQCINGIQWGEISSRNNYKNFKSAKPDFKFESLNLKTKSKSIQLIGRLQNLFVNTNCKGTATVVFYPGSFKVEKLLNPFLFYLVSLLQEGEHEISYAIKSGPFKIYYIYEKENSNKKKYKIGEWGPFNISVANAKAYLEELIEFMLGEINYDLLPLRLVEEKLTHKNELIDGLNYFDELNMALEESDDSISEHPIFVLSETMKILKPTVPLDAEAKIRARFGLFFNSIISNESLNDE